MSENGEDQDLQKQKEAQKKIWGAVKTLIEKFDEDGNGFIDQNECKALLHGVLSGMEREYDDSLLEKYYNDKTYCKDPSQGIDREGLFMMLCDLNDIPVEAGTFQWSAALVAMAAFD